MEVEVPYESNKNKSESIKYIFEDKKFLNDFQTLRIPIRDDMFKLENGKLRIIGRQSLSSRFKQSTICRRQQHFCFSAETSMTFETNDFQKMAGLIYRYNERNQFFLRMSFDNETNKNVIGIIAIDKGALQIHNELPVNLKNNKIWLKLDVEYSNLKFSFSVDGENWTRIGNVFDASILSDDYDTQSFTGAFVGMSCVDTRDYKAVADFDYFNYIVNS